jgi:sulfur-oxidizing protein SoxZ
MARALVSVPAKAKKGQVVEMRALISHPMETGFRPDRTGKMIPRDIIHTFTCTYNGAEVFRASLYPAISANPFLSFTTIATESGELEFRWEADDGKVFAEKAKIVVG